jgi:cytosine/adenosine deaminase-related metal-dependent hydrolase
MPDENLTLAGVIVRGDAFEPVEGYLLVEDGTIVEFGEGLRSSALQGIIIPALVNAHTHIGDSVAKEPPTMPLERLVGPGGFKHRILAETPGEVLRAAMQATIEDMAAAGTQLFADFREGGVAGARVLRDMFEAAGGRRTIGMKLLGRPADATDTSDLAELLDSVDGIGLSSVADYPAEVVQTVADAARRAGKLFGLHAGERTAVDIRGAIELEPDFMVHLTKATVLDFKAMEERGIAAVVCLRSNLLTGLGLPAVPQMLAAGLTVAVGTDNVMLNAPDLLTEMEFLAKLYRLDEREVLKLCTLNPARVLREADSVGTIEEGKRANLVVIRTDTPNMRHLLDPIKGVVQRATRHDIAAVIYEGKMVRSVKSSCGYMADT